MGVLKDKFDEFASTTSCHGFDHIASAEKCGVRFFWALIVVIGVVLSGVQTYYLICQFYSYPKIVQTSVSTCSKVAYIFCVYIKILLSFEK